MRDLLKWAGRVAASSEGNLDPEVVVMEGMDCFCNHLAASCDTSREQVLGLGRTFGLLTDNIDHLTSERCPVVTISETSVKVGRALLRRLPAAVAEEGGRHYFLTKQASKLLEFVACAVSNSEPVLLVGETGVGKTSAVQHLADSVGKRLQSVNLNQQTESSDLLGGFKPVDFDHFMVPVRSKFEALFQTTFSAKDNVKFMAHLSRCHGAKRWPDLVQLMSHATKGAIKKLSR